MIRIVIIVNFVALVTLCISVRASVLPQIDAYSHNSINLNRGDPLYLEVKLKHYDTVVWLYHDKEICSETVCEINTNLWYSGIHNIKLKAENKFGSAEVSYSIFVEKADLKKEKKDVRPKLITDKKNIKFLDLNKLSTRSLSGFGMLVTDQDEKILINENFLNLSSSTNTVSTKANTILQLRKKNYHEHFLFENTRIIVTKWKNEDLIFSMVKGKFRSRKLREKSKNHFILVHNIMQIEANTQADIFVELLDSDHAQLILLRGKAKITPNWQNRNADIDIHSGECMHADKKTKKIYKINCRSITTEDVLIKTTPIYIFDEEFEDDWDEESKITTATTLEKDIHLAEKKIDERDYLYTLDLLSSYANQAEKNYKLALALGKASLGLYLFKQANEFFSMARLLEKKKSDPLFYLGLSNMLQNNLLEADKFFRKSLSSNEKYAKIIEYNRGIINYKKERYFPAQWKLQSVIWNQYNDSVVISAREILDEIKNKNYNIDIFLSLMKQSNVFAVPAAENLPAGINNQGSRGYDLRGHFAYKIFDEKFFKSLMNIKTHHTLYDEQDTQLGALSNEKINLAGELVIPDKLKKEWFIIDGSVGILFNHLDNKIIEQQFGWDLGYQHLVTWGKPKFKYGDWQNFDNAPKDIKLRDLDIGNHINEPRNRSRRIKQFDVVVFPEFNNIPVVSAIGLTMSQTRYIAEESSEDHHHDISLKLACFPYTIFPQVKVSGELSLKQKRFTHNQDKASIFSLRINPTYNWLPSFNVFLLGKYTKQNSSRNPIVYSDSYIALGIHHFR